MARSSAPSRYARLLAPASVCVVVAALYLARGILVPLALAILLSFLLAPVAHRLERYLHRVAAVLIAVLGALAVMGAIGYVVYGQFAALAHDLPQYRSNIEAKIRLLQSHLDGEFSRAARTAEEIVTQATSQPATANADGPVGVPVHVVNAAEPQGATAGDDAFFSAGLGAAANVLSTAGIVLVLVLFILLQRDDLRDRLIRLVGHGRLTLTTAALDDAATRVSRYLIAQSIVNGAYGLAIALGLWLIGAFMTDAGFPNFALWGLLCALLRFIPYVGPWIGAAFPLGLSIIAFPGLGVFVAVGTLFVAVELLSNNLMEPWLYGASTGVSPVAIIFAAIFWTWLWGPVGLILATPLTVCLAVLGRYVPQLEFLDVLLGDAPVFRPHQAFYQRLVALNEEDARDLADEYLVDHTLIELYDAVMIPALGLAERDRLGGVLDDRRREFVRKSLRDIVGDMEGGDLGGAGGAAARQGGAPLPSALPAGCAVNVLCLPARDEADELAARMLAQVLGAVGYRAQTVSAKSLAGEMLQQIQTQQAQVIVVSAMPPAAALHARYLCKRLHARYPGSRLLVILWNTRGDLDKALKRIACAPGALLANSLAGAIGRIEQLVEPLLVKRKSS